MKKIQIIIPLLLITMIFLSGVDPLDISQAIKEQSKALKNKLILKLTQEKLFDNSKKIDIKAFPVFSVKSDRLKSEISDYDLNLEKEPSFFIIHYDSTTYYLNNYLFDNKGVELKFKLQKESPFKEVISKAENQSNAVFLLYTIGMPVIGYIEKNHIKFIDVDLKVHESLKSFIEYRFGSIENYRNEVERNNFENQYLGKVTTFNEAKLIYQNYWFNYFRYNIYDPTSLTNALIFEIEEFIKITDYQKEELKKNLLKAIKENGLGKKDIQKLSIVELTFYNELLNSVIKQELRKVLLFNQYGNFISNEELFKQLDEKAEDIINVHYKDELKITTDSLLRKAVIKEIFKQ